MDAARDSYTVYSSMETGILPLIGLLHWIHQAQVLQLLSSSTLFSEKKHPLLFSCITLRKSNQFE